MDRGVPVPEQKLAEKLLILNERGVGMLTRIYNIKKACSDPQSRPAFLSDKSLEQAIRLIVRKFPAVESHTRNPSLQPVMSIHGDIVKGLSNYYYTFVDVMEFKDQASELLTAIDASFVHFDINLNFDLTKAYLDLMVNYITLVILVSRVEDRKAVLGLFNHAFDMQNGRIEESFPRLGQMILDYENPMKRLAEEFIPHQQRVATALLSLQEMYFRRYLSGEKWRQAQILSIISIPPQMLTPAQSEVIPCEYLPVEIVNRWIIFGFTVCHTQLALQGVSEMWKRVLSDGFAIPLFRDEIFLIHKEIQTFFDGIKGYNKKVKEIQDCAGIALSASPAFHRERRNYLRSSMDELCLILSDQPGLLGPKALTVMQALSLAQDEISWLVRHNSTNPHKGRKNPDDFIDKDLPQLLMLVEELRVLVGKYSSVVQRYFIQYLSGFDVTVLKEVVQKISICPEDVSLLMTSFVDTLSSLSVKQVDAGDTFDLQGLRLDWMRLQAYTSVRGSAPDLKENRDLACLMNTIIFHSKLVDVQETLLCEAADLTMFCFYPSFFENAFVQCVENPLQSRYSIAFPLICSHFMDCTSDFCPEERHPIGDRSLSAINLFLESMSKEARGIIKDLCKEHIILKEQLATVKAVYLLKDDPSRKAKKDKNKKNLHSDFSLPGTESYRKNREELTMSDKKLLALTELCSAITHVPMILVWEHTFSPKEYLTAHLEDFFGKTVVSLLKFNPDTQDIARPSDVLSNIKVLMSCLQTIEHYANIDMARLFNHILLQQTQPQDSHGANTITNIYASWYLDVLLRRVTTSAGIIYSPSRRAFVSKQAMTFKAEEYTDITELQALAELLGPYGMKYLVERLMQQIGSQVGELKKLVLENKQVLVNLRSDFAQQDHCMELVRRLKNVEDVMTRMTIIGFILCFRSLIQDALFSALNRRVPFLMSSIQDFKEHYPQSNSDRVIVEEMASSAGIHCDVDPILCTSLRQHKEKKLEDDVNVWSLLLVFIAVSLPSLAYKETSEYNSQFEANENNCHCIAKAVNALAGGLFTNNGQDITERLREFLAIASSSLLKLGMETDKDLPRARESVYLILDQVVQESPFLTIDMLESFFPYTLLRDAYHHVYRRKEMPRRPRPSVEEGGF